MAGRNQISRGICVATALLVLIAVVSSPLVPSRQSEKTFQVNGLRRNVKTLPTDSGRLYLQSVAIDTASATSADAIERVEEDEFVRMPASELFFLRLPHSSSPKRPVRLLRAITSNSASQVLRC